MVNIYVPIEIVFQGKTYLGNSYQDVPEELADIISSDSEMSKVKPLPQVDKYRHLRGQKLSYLQSQLSDFELDLAERKKVLDVHLKMGSVAPKNLIQAYKCLSGEYQELKAYLAPIIAQKQAEEMQRRAKIMAASKARGTIITFDNDGNFSEFYPTEKIAIGVKQNDKPRRF